MAEWKCMTERRWCKRDNMCKECAEAEDRREMARLRVEAAKPTPERIAAALALAEALCTHHEPAPVSDDKFLLERLAAYRAALPKLRTRAVADLRELVRHALPTDAQSRARDIALHALEALR